MSERADRAGAALGGDRSGAERSSGASSSARGVAATAFAGALLAFALPLGAVSNCDGEEVRFTGVELVTLDVPPSESEPGTLHEDVERHAWFFAACALLAALLGLVLVLAGRPRAGICASAGLVSAQLLGGAIMLSGDAGSSLLAGFWLLLLSLALAGVVYLGSAVARRRRAGRRVWTYVLAQCCVALSPMLAVAVLIAIAVVANA